MKVVWIVDDDAEMGLAVSLMLKLLDCETKHYIHPRLAAQALLAGGRPDLMILDINMPEVSGLDMLEFLRRRKEWKDLPVIMLSTEAQDVTVDKAMRLGADGYVMKPVTIEELEKVMSEAFYRHIVK
jgi:two-component system, chemotaxis family, chemotaxis protein CheY